MAKTLKIIALACFIGATLAACFFFSKKETPEAKEKYTAYAFQVGVYKIYDNAVNAQNKYATAKIIFDGEYYRLFLGATINNQELLKKYLADKEFYIKEISIDIDSYNTILKCDELLKKASLETYPEILKMTLEGLNEL